MSEEVCYYFKTDSFSNGTFLQKWLSNLLDFFNPPSVYVKHVCFVNFTQWVKKTAASSLPCSNCPIFLFSGQKKNCHFHIFGCLSSFILSLIVCGKTFIFGENFVTIRKFCAKVTAFDQPTSFLDCPRHLHSSTGLSYCNLSKINNNQIKSFFDLCLDSCVICSLPLPFLCRE